RCCISLRSSLCFFLLLRRPPRPPFFPYTTLFRSEQPPGEPEHEVQVAVVEKPQCLRLARADALEPGAIGRPRPGLGRGRGWRGRSEEHTSELQSLTNLVCRLLLEKKKMQEYRQ